MKFDKSYTEHERLKRFEIFSANYNRISALKVDQPYARFSYLTRWADKTRQEFDMMHGGFGGSTPCQFTTDGEIDYLKPTAEPQEYLDYVKMGATVEVKNQGECSSCWAHATTAVVEGRLFLDTGNTTSLSEQYLIDCDKSRICRGCCGGLSEDSLQWLAGESGAPGGGQGIPSEMDYPYASVDGVDPNLKCNTSAPMVATLNGFGVLSNPTDASVVSAITQYGVLSVAIDAHVLQFYTGGVITDGSACTSTNHAVAIVGYGSEDGIDYYKIRNSYGEEFGEEGYFRISYSAAVACGAYGCVTGGTQASYV